MTIYRAAALSAALGLVIAGLSYAADFTPLVRHELFWRGQTVVWPASIPLMLGALRWDTPLPTVMEFVGIAVALNGVLYGLLGCFVWFVLRHRPRR